MWAKNFGVAHHVIDDAVFIGLMGGFIELCPAGRFEIGSPKQSRNGSSSDSSGFPVLFVDVFDRVLQCLNDRGIC